MENGESLEIILDGYKVVQKIGSGGFCNVYLIKQNETGNELALKLLRDDVRFEEPEHNIKLLRDEAKLITQMSQFAPNHFPNQAIYISSPNHGIVTEFVPLSLTNRLGKMEVDEALGYWKQSASAVQLLHEHGGISCLGDIKPSNFRIDRKGNVKIVDLNLKYVDKDASVESLTNSLAHSIIENSKTKERIIGTPRYMAPEQWGGKADERTDVYQLSSLAYEMITGIKPEGRFKPLEDIVPEAGFMDEIVNRGMAPSPSERFTSVKELIAKYDSQESQLPSKSPENALEKVVEKDRQIAEGTVARLALVQMSHLDYAENGIRNSSIQFLGSLAAMGSSAFMLYKYGSNPAFAHDVFLATLSPILGVAGLAGSITSFFNRCVYSGIEKQARENLRAIEKDNPIPFPELFMEIR